MSKEFLASAAKNKKSSYKCKHQNYIRLEGRDELYYLHCDKYNNSCKSVPGCSEEFEVLKHKTINFIVGGILFLSGVLCMYVVGN